MYKIDSEREITTEEKEELIKIYDKFIALSEQSRLMVSGGAQVLAEKEKR